MEALKQLVSDREHRQEIVVNGLGPYLSRRAFSKIRRARRVHSPPPHQISLNLAVALEAARESFGPTFCFTNAR